MKRHRSAHTGRYMYISESKKRKVDVINQNIDCVKTHAITEDHSYCSSKDCSDVPILLSDNNED
jgi:hypothetical protein